MLRRALAFVVAGGLLAGGIVALREATLTRHVQDVPGEAVRLDLRVRAQLEEMPPGTTLPQLAAAVVAACAPEVRGSPEGPPELLGDPQHEEARFTTTFRPALGESDQVQLTGCVEDWLVDHVLVDVERLVVLGLDRPAGAG